MKTTVYNPTLTAVNLDEQGVVVEGRTRNDVVMDEQASRLVDMGYLVLVPEVADAAGDEPDVAEDTVEGEKSRKTRK